MLNKKMKTNFISEVVEKNDIISTMLGKGTIRSILENMKIYPKLTKGAIIMIHDYNHKELKDGVRAACNDFLKGKIIGKDNLGIIVME